MVGPRRPLLRGAMIGDAGYLAGPVAPARSDRPDLVSKLQQLRTLNDAGVLTRDEFVAAKRKLLTG
jgi:hypothetical protein